MGVACDCLGVTCDSLGAVSDKISAGVFIKMPSAYVLARFEHFHKPQDVAGASEGIHGHVDLCTSK